MANILYIGQRKKFEELKAREGEKLSWVAPTYLNTTWKRLDDYDSVVIDSTAQEGFEVDVQSLAKHIRNKFKSGPVTILSEDSAFFRERF